MQSSAKSAPTSNPPGWAEALALQTMGLEPMDAYPCGVADPEQNRFELIMLKNRVAELEQCTMILMEEITLLRGSPIPSTGKANDYGR